MRSAVEYLKRWLHPGVFAIWMLFLIYLLVSMRYVAFLRPEFGILLAIAHLIAMGFMLAAMVRARKTEMNEPAVLRALVLLIPVLYTIVIPDSMLSSQAFKKRFIGTHNQAITRQGPSTLFSQEDENKSNPASPSGEFEGSQSETPLELTILDIFRNPDLFKGKRVVVTGMIVHDEQFKQYFGGRDAAVYRFLINCCAADALPLAIALESDEAAAFANDQWVQVDGIFDLQQIDGKPVPLFSKTLIKPIEAPAVPYLF